MITLIMELWTALASWLTGRIPSGAQSVWNVLWNIPDAEWAPKPAGQHRAGTPVWDVVGRLQAERKPARGVARVALPW